MLLLFRIWVHCIDLALRLLQWLAGRKWRASSAVCLFRFSHSLLQSYLIVCHTNSILKVDNNPISCSGHPILRTNLVTSIKVEWLMLSQKLFLNSKFLSNKVICTSATCTESGFIHAGCLRAIEDVLIHYLTSRHKR